MLQRLLNGEDVINKVIIENTELAMKLAHRHTIGKTRAKQMDIRQAAMLGLVEGVHYVFDHRNEFHVDGVLPCMNRVIQNKICDFCNTDFIIPIPSRSRDRAAENGTPIFPPTVFSIHFDDDNDYEIADPHQEVTDTTLELQNYLVWMLSPMEKKVFELRLLDYSQADIARLLDCSKSWVNQVVAKIRGKYETIPTHYKREALLQRQRILQARIERQDQICPVGSDTNTLACGVL